MANGINKVIIIGNLGADPEIRYLANGSAVCNFSIAVNESWKDKDGKRQEKTEWVNIVTWKRLAEVCAEYLKKGKQVYIEGKIQTRQWDDKEGKTRYSTEVVADQMQMLNDSPPTHTPEDTSPLSPGGDEMDDVPF